MNAAGAIRAARAVGVSVAVDGESLLLEAAAESSQSVLDDLARHKPQIVELLRDERRAVVRWIAENFRSSPIGQCALCGGGKRNDNPFVLVFVGEDRADLHSSCHPTWLAEQEAKASAALGIDTSDKQGR
jgi:hypothetical protein